MSYEWNYIAGLSVRLDKLFYNVTEGSDVTIVIVADRPLSRKFSVLLTTQSITATSGMLCTYLVFYYIIVNLCLVADYVNGPFEVEFGPNQTETYWSIHTQEDLILETNEEFIVKLELMEEERMIGVQISEHDNSASVTIINKNGECCMFVSAILMIKYCQSFQLFMSD